MFPNGYYKCIFLVLGMTLTILGLYPPPKSVWDEPHENITSRRFTIFLRSNGFDWIDVIKYAPKGMCKDVNLHVMQDQIRKDKTLLQDALRRVRANGSKCVYVAGSALNDAVHDWISDIPDHEQGRVIWVHKNIVYVDDLIFIVGRKHPSAHLWSQTQEDREEIMETAKLCRAVMEMADSIPKESFKERFAEHLDEHMKEKHECVSWFCSFLGKPYLPEKLKHWGDALTRKNTQSAIHIVSLIGMDAASHIPAIALFLGEMLLKSLQAVGDCCHFENWDDWQGFMCHGVASAVAKDCHGFIDSLKKVRECCHLHKPADFLGFMCDGVASALAKDCDGFIDSLKKVGKVCDLHEPADWRVFMCHGVAYALAKDCDGFIQSLKKVGNVCDLH